MGVRVGRWLIAARGIRDYLNLLGFLIVWVGNVTRLDRVEGIILRIVWNCSWVYSGVFAPLVCSCLYVSCVTEMEGGQNGVLVEPPVFEPPGGGSSGALLVNFTSMYECQVCASFICAPIVQCRYGHVICSVCADKLTRSVSLYLVSFFIVCSGVQPAV